MGIPKHGKDSHRSRACKKYKENGQRELNKMRKQERLAAGKKVKSKKKPYSRFHAMDIMIANAKPLNLHYEVTDNDKQ
jgi:hypothetical protein